MNSDQKLANAVSVLQQLEYGGFLTEGQGRECPICRQTRKYGHDSDCRLALSLKENGQSPKIHSNA